jgi:hypothetical protein
MKRNEIWIFCQGGCVTQVKATDPSLKVNLIDYDELAVDDEKKEEYKELELLSEGQALVF